jgi:hypothetical protein
MAKISIFWFVAGSLKKKLRDLHGIRFFSLFLWQEEKCQHL